MTILGLPVSYADVTYADGINNSSEWVAAGNAAKESSLQWARVYIDDLYNCSFNVDDPGDQVKTANSMLAEEHIKSPLFDAATLNAPEKGLSSEEVKAGTVSVKTTYDTNKSNNWVDPYPEITALLLLGGICSLLSGGGMSFSPLVRR